ncbi:MAG TPA: 3-oxoacyl-ACP reductase FabG [Negativicutes bacterium]|nr:3-oxoacyl-ACP reductase FabG [Negativicutes bacterium]
MRVEGKVAVVTGAGRGIGRAIAERLAAAGAQVVVVDMNEEGCRATKEAIEKQGGKAVAVACDVSKRAAVEKMAAAAAEAFGRIDILVNNAGITRDAMLGELTEEQWDAVLNVNLKAAFLCSQAALKYMTPEEGGKIISISSIAGEMGNMGQANYAASKAGIIGLTKTLAKELARRRICVNAIAPGLIDSEMTQAVPDKVKEYFVKQIPLGRMGKPSEIASACLFLASGEADYITGQVLRVNGGWYL